MNEKQRVFVAEYLKDLNATQAAIRAGYSAKTAGSQGERLLKNADVQIGIQAAQAKRLAKLDLTAENILEEVRRISLFDPASILDADGKMLPIHRMPAEARAVIAGVEVATDGTLKLKFWDKNSAIKAAMANLALLAPTEHRHEVLLRDMSDDEVRARAAQLIAKTKGNQP